MKKLLEARIKFAQANVKRQVRVLLMIMNIPFTH